MNPKFPRVHCGCDSSVSAYLEDLLGLIIADVKVKQLLLKVESVAALLDTLRIVIDLEQEEDVMSVYLTIMLVNQFIDGFLVGVWSHGPINLRLLL